MGKIKFKTTHGFCTLDDEGVLRLSPDVIQKLLKKQKNNKLTDEEVKVLSKMSGHKNEKLQVKKNKKS